MKLILRVDSLLAENWWIDAPYNTHDDYRGNTGYMMSLGKGGILGFYMKQKLNVKIYTVGVLVGAHHGLSVFLWNSNFI